MNKIPLLLVFLVSIGGLNAFAQDRAKQMEHKHQPDPTFDRKNALHISQSAIGNQVGNLHFVSGFGERIQLTDYQGKPLIISLIYTSCFHICPTTTKHLDNIVSKAEKVLGDDTFNVISVGFDTITDTADAMRIFAKQQSVNMDNWDFLATDKNSIMALSKDLGFQFFSSPSGFDHLVQTTLLDENGIVVRQVYGMEFKTPHLVGPLKELIFSEQADHSLFQEITAKVRLFCTVYDPYSDSYKFDYSIFVGLFVGVFIGGFMVIVVIREWRKSSASNSE